MDCFEDESQRPGFELKPAAGFAKGARRPGDVGSAPTEVERRGYKNFDGCITTLQMQTYLIIRKFERRRNKRGQEYGMAVSWYQKPEELWGYEHVTSAYKEEPAVSAERICKRTKELFPGASEAAYRKVLK